jgi:hypothetical protein
LAASWWLLWLVACALHVCLLDYHKAVYRSWGAPYFFPFSAELARGV